MWALVLELLSLALFASSVLDEATFAGRLLRVARANGHRTRTSQALQASVPSRRWIIAGLPW